MNLTDRFNKWLDSFMRDAGYASDDEKLQLIEKQQKKKKEGKEFCVEMIHHHNPTSILYIPIHSIKTYIDMGWHIYDDEYKKQYHKKDFSKIPMIIN